MIICRGDRSIRCNDPRGILDYCWGIFPALASLFVCCAGWQYVHERLGSMLMPSPSHVLTEVLRICGEREGQSTIFTTLMHGGVGIGIALLCGICSGLIAGSNRTLAIMLRPIATLLIGTPPIIWVVLA